NKAAPDTSAPDATTYTVTFEIAGSERSVRSAVTDASNLESLKRQAPVGAAGLIRRAVADRDRILAALYTEGRYAGTVTITVAGRSPDDATTYDAVNAARRWPGAGQGACGAGACVQVWRRARARHLGPQAAARRPDAEA